MKYISITTLLFHVSRVKWVDSPRNQQKFIWTRMS